MRTSCIRLRRKSRIAVLYEDFLEICDGNMLAAMLLAILVYWTDIKIAKKDKNLWIWKTHEDFQEDLMFDKPGMKPPHRTTIKAALDLLENKGFIQRRKNPKMPLDQTRQYLVEQDVIQAAIDALPPIVEKPTMESWNTDNGMSESQQSTSENQQSNAEKPTSNTNDYNTEITESVITEKESTPTSLSAFAERKKATDPKLVAITQEMLAEKVIAPKITLPSKQTPIPQSQVNGPPDVAPPASVGLKGASTAPAGAGKRTQEKKKVTQASDIQPVPKCSTKEIQARINAYRGYALEEEIDIIRERKAIKAWCNLHTIEEFDLVLHYLTTQDKYWKLEENKYRIGGLTLLKETPKALAEMERRHNGKTHQGPPDFSKAELVDEQWNIYKIPGDDTEYTYWPLVGGKLMPVAEADLLGYNGGAGLYNVTQYKERAAR